MYSRSVLTALLIGWLVLAGVSTGPGVVEAQEAPPDPETDVLGWEQGYWYNETLDVETSDGLSPTEVEAVVARTMARVERVRQLEFTEDVGVRIINRSTYRNRTARLYGNMTTEMRLHQNIKYEAVFMVNQSTDVVEIQRENRAGSVIGFYSTVRDELVLVSEEADSVTIDERTLAHELVHALQDQHFGLGEYERQTTEQNNAVNGLIEGDANYVQHLFEARCEDGGWGECLIPTDRTGGSVAHLGLYVISFQPYSDGPSFVERIQKRRGWEGVNAVYEAPPASTEQVIHPVQYGVDEPTSVSIEDRSTAEWRVLDLNHSINYAVFGEAGVFSMFLYPAFDQTSRTEIIPLDAFLTTNDPVSPYNYDSQYSAGWDGDKLLPYIPNASLPDPETRRTGYVWKTTWDTERDAEEFLAGYRQLLEYHGARHTGSGTYVVPYDSGFSGAIHVNKTERDVLIVKAPLINQLNSIRAGTVQESSKLPEDGELPEPEPGPEGTPLPPESPEDNSISPAPDEDSNPDDTAANGDQTAETPTTPGSSSPGQPGFTAALGLIALLVFAVARRR